MAILKILLIHKKLVPWDHFLSFAGKNYSWKPKRRDLRTVRTNKEIKAKRNSWNPPSRWNPQRDEYGYGACSWFFIVTSWISRSTMINAQYLFHSLHRKIGIFREERPLRMGWHWFVNCLLHSPIYGFPIFVFGIHNSHFPHTRGAYSPTVSSHLGYVVSSSPSIEGRTWLYISVLRSFKRDERLEKRLPFNCNLIFSLLVITDSAFRVSSQNPQSSLFICWWWDTEGHANPWIRLPGWTDSMLIPKWNLLTNCLVCCNGNAGIGMAYECTPIPRASSSQAKLCHKLGAHHPVFRVHILEQAIVWFNPRNYLSEGLILVWIHVQISTSYCSRITKCLSFDGEGKIPNEREGKMKFWEVKSFHGIHTSRFWDCLETEDYLQETKSLNQMIFFRNRTLNEYRALHRRDERAIFSSSVFLHSTNVARKPGKLQTDNITSWVIILAWTGSTRGK
jgi:hypothetical protein